MNLKHCAKRFGKNPVKTVKYPVQVMLFTRRHPGLGALIRRVREDRKTFLSPENLADLAEAVLDLEFRQRPGAVVEAGTALGGSAILLASAKNPERPMKVYDAFGMIPPPTEKDGADVHARYETIVKGDSVGIGDDLYYGYHEDLLSEVIDSFAAYGVPVRTNNVEFVKGYYNESMHVSYPVALAHLDCDWYESLMTCLEQIEPHLIPGGRFVIDDYYNWSGCTRAVDEFFSGRAAYQFVHKSRLHIVKAE